ncbi:PAP2 superfamily protein [Prauserella shujinwangii]|uniref:PAP2 superfamily protein n=1 Tax=Prauserella shujinwangii TaxID=1453103 RepID=A0A2T0M3L0_9PSEU|nr:PAP2 superfamily protein [Prauserella shujinwangii]
MAVVAAALTLALGLWHAGGSAPGPLDRAVADAVHAVLTGHEPLLRPATLPTHPAVVLAAIGAVAATCLARGRPRAALLAVVAPAVTVPVNTWLLKPGFGRMYGDHLAYPSGHTVSLATVLTVVVLLVPPGGWTRTAAVAVAALPVTLAGIGMVGLGYHYGTDIVGGAAFAVAATVAVAALLARLPGGRQRRTVPGEGGEPADRA